MESLSGILAFVHAARLRSYVAAGAQLGISASAVGKSVARLEDGLGVRLLNRSTRRISLTEEGELFLERCARIVRELEEAEAEVTRGRQSPRGRLRVSLPAIGYRMLVPLLPEFTRRYPEIELDLDFSDRIVDLIGEGVDVAMRSGSFADSRLKARPLGAYRFAVVASPAYLAARGAPLKPVDLGEHARLAFRHAGDGQCRNGDSAARRKTPRRRCAPRWPSTMWRRWWAPPRPAWAWPMCRTSPCANCCMTASWSRPWRTGPRRAAASRCCGPQHGMPCPSCACSWTSWPSACSRGEDASRARICRAAACARRVGASPTQAAVALV